MGKETTKKVIAYAFKELLAEKPINKITIGDIAQKCDINRQTFYYHFHDIIDLIDWICETEGENALKNTTYATWKDGFRRIFEILLKDKPLVTNVYRHTPAEYLNKILYRVCYQLLYAVVCEQAADMPIAEEEKMFIANFYKFGFVGLLTDWIAAGMTEDPEIIVARLSNLIEGSMKNALKKYSGQ